MKVKVRIAIAVDASGDWNSCGCKGMDDDDAMGIASDTVASGEARYWLTAEVDVPEPVTIDAAVEAVS